MRPLLARRKHVTPRRTPPDARTERSGRGSAPGRRYRGAVGSPRRRATPRRKTSAGRNVYADDGAVVWTRTTLSLPNPMYTTCMFCGTSLGTNEVIETFPVGRRLAFDESRGRLWVVCKSCERWNLTPLEERWEAVEDCERIFRETTLRSSTENIGLARVPEGLELVRIGEPLRNEFAAWRYGDQFGRRRKKYLTYTIGGGALILGATILGPIAAGISLSSFSGMYHLIGPMMNRRHRAKLHTDDGRILKVPVEKFGTIRLRPGDDGQSLRLRLFKGKKEEWFEGPEAERFASRLIPKVNRSGAKKDAVTDAVRAIEDAGHPERFVKDLVAREDFAGGYRDYGAVTKMPS